MVGLAGEVAARFRAPERVPIGLELSADYFSIFDSDTELRDGALTQQILPDMKYILSSTLAPYPLKAVTNLAVALAWGVALAQPINSETPPPPGPRAPAAVR